MKTNIGRTGILACLLAGEKKRLMDRQECLSYLEGNTYAKGYADKHDTVDLAGTTVGEVLCARRPKSCSEPAGP